MFFIVFSITVNSIYLIVIGITDWNFSKRVESLRFKDPDYDLLVLGTSLADYGIDTELLSEYGIESFNLALVGSSIKTCYIQLEEYIEKYNKSPKYVLLPINSYLERFDQEGIQPIVEFTMKDQVINLKDVPLSKFNWQTTELIKKALSSEYRSGYVSYGQTRRKKMEPDRTKYDENYLDFKKIENSKWLGKVAKLCIENNIELLIIEIPGEKYTQNLTPEGPYVIDFNNGSNAMLYNLNSRDFCKFIDSDKDWSGLSHFNMYGATKFTKKLIETTNLN